MMEPLELTYKDPSGLLNQIAETVPRVAIRALRKTGQQMRTAAVSIITERFNVRSAEVRNRITLREKPSEAAVILRAQGRPLPMVNFANVSRRNQLSVRIIKGRTVNPRGWFIQRMQSGHIGVFSRSENGMPLPKVAPSRGRYAGRVIQRGPNKGQPLLRQQIREVFAISVAHMFGTSKVASRLQQIFNEKFPQVLKHELDFEMSRLKPR